MIAIDAIARIGVGGDTISKGRYKKKYLVCFNAVNFFWKLGLLRKLVT